MSGANRAPLEYHLRELDIAEDRQSDRQSLPEVPPTCRRLLDVGCGIGQSLIALKLSPSVEAHGVDIDEEAVAFGASRSPHLHLRAGSGEALPYSDQYFDMVMCRVSLPYMHVPTALHEFHRVLQPGGQLWLTLHPMSMFRRDFAAAVRRGSARGVVYRLYALLNTVLLFAGRQIRFPFNRARIESYQPRIVIRRQLHQVGFRDVKGWVAREQSLVTALRAQAS